MSRRSGITLVEVLVAIFVMSIGLIALLTLFPIGMLRMGRAIRDDHSAQSGHDAHVISIIHNLGNDGNMTSPGVVSDGVTADLFVNPFPAGLKNADPYGESYPIFVDPIGYFNVFGVAQNWVGGSQGVLRRRPVEFVSRGLAPTNIAARNLRIFTSFTLWDDMIFESTMGAVNLPGTPKTIAGGVLRDPRFSWGYTMRRPQTSDRSVVDCSVVVFDNRSLAISGNGSLLEYVYQNNTYFNPANNTITIDHTNPAVVAPPLRPNDWILDVTMSNPTPTTGTAHCYWYRVVASEDLVVAGKKLARYEVQQPIRGFTTPAGVADPAGSGAPVYLGTSVVLDGVADVFEKGPGRLP